MFEIEFGVQVVIFVIDGGLCLIIVGEMYDFMLGGFVYILVDIEWLVENGVDILCFYWWCKCWQFVLGVDKFDVLIVNECDIILMFMFDMGGSWVMMCFVDFVDLCYDMYIIIVMLMFGGLILFVEIYVMEYGLFVIEGKVVYCLNCDWVEVGFGDFMWLCVFCL